MTHVPTVERDLALIRVKCSPAERAELANLADIFRGRIVDVAADSVIVEVTGDVDKVDGLVELLQPRGIVEMVRTGKVAMVRGPRPRTARPRARRRAAARDRDRSSFAEEDEQWPRSTTTRTRTSEPRGQDRGRSSATAARATPTR